MRFHSVRTLLLLQYISCHIHQAYSQLNTATITTKLKNKKHKLLACQSCLLSHVGALRAKLTLQKYGPENSKVLIEEFTITATHSEFLKLYPLCASKDFCGPMSISPSSIVNHDPNVVNEQVLADIKQPSSSLGKALQTERRNSEIVCIVQPSSNAKCRSCLTESSESAYLGEFNISTPVTKWKLALHIFSTRVPLQDMVDFCFDRKACPTRAAPISGQTCKHLIGESPLRDIPLNDDGDLYISRDQDKAESIMRMVQAHLDSVRLEQLCFKIDPVTFGTLRDRIKRVARTKNGIAVVFQSENGHEQSRRYLSLLIPSDQALVENKELQKSNDLVEPDICNKLNAKYFNIVPVADPFPDWVSQSHERAPQYGPIRHPTKCIWAFYHDNHTKACHSCVERVTVSRNGIKAYFISKFSPTSSLHFLQGGITETPLTECNLKAVCFNLVFVPEFICEHEFDQKSFLTKEQQAAEIVLTRSADKNQENKKLMSGSDPLTSIFIRSSPALAEHAKAARLFVKNIDLTSKVIQRRTAHSASADKLTVSAAKRTQVSKSKTPCSERNVMLIRYDYANHQTCLESLALKYDVLMISPSNQYIWMICEHEKIISGDGCNDISIVFWLQRDVDVLRTVSAYSVRNHFPVTAIPPVHAEIYKSQQRSNVFSYKVESPNQIVAKKTTLPRKRYANGVKRAMMVKPGTTSKESIDVVCDEDEEEEEDDDDEDYTIRRVRRRGRGRGRGRSRGRSREEAISTSRKGGRKASRSGEDSPSKENSDSVGKDPLHFLHNVPKKERTPTEVVPKR